jgi:hypothetical protein
MIVDVGGGPRPKKHLKSIDSQNKLDLLRSNTLGIQGKWAPSNGTSRKQFSFETRKCTMLTFEYQFVWIQADMKVPIRIAESSSSRRSLNPHLSVAGRIGGAGAMTEVAQR